MGSLLTIGIVVLVIFFAVILFITRYYHRIPPSKAMVIFGSGKEPRIITGSGVFVKPFIEDYKYLDLTIITIKTEKDEVYTQSGVPIQLDWVSQVQIDSEHTAMRTAAQAFLDKTREDVQQIIEETLSANFRAIVGQMSVESIHRDRDAFVQSVQDLASDDVSAMGVRIISMGIEEITDNEGYLQAMAAPQIAAVKRDAKIAEAEAEREARIKAANATQAAEQAELDAQREILQQREALQLREVEVQRKVDIEMAEADQATQQKRALAVEQQQEAEVLVPARAKRQAVEIEAESNRRKIEIEAEANRQRIEIEASAAAKATREKALADAEATEKRGLAEAAAYEAQQRAEAEGEKAKLIAEAHGREAEAAAEKASLLAEAEGIQAKLLAEAEGRRELAAATAAEDAINLRQFIIEEVTKADVAKVEAIAQALAGLGGNVRVVQFGDSGSGGNGHGSNAFMNLLMDIPETADMFRTKVEALSGEDFDKTMARLMTMFNSLKEMDAERDFGGNGTGENGQQHAALNPGTENAEPSGD